jgi:hypothetical protein
MDKSQGKYKIQYYINSPKEYYPQEVHTHKLSRHSLKDRSDNYITTQIKVTPKIE